jgi:hypothetical protein
LSWSASITTVSLGHTAAQGDSEMNQFQSAVAMVLCLSATCGGQIRVNVYNDAAVSDHTLAFAQKEASRILKDAGVTLSWCRRVIPGEPCASPGPATIQVRLYPRGGELNYNVSPNSLAVAVTSPAPEFGSFVGVFNERVRNGRTVHGYGLMLGHVIAHELGHLLLERSAHSRNGLMKASWDNPQRNLIAIGRLLFDRIEAREIQTNVRARLAAAEGTSDGK